MTSLSRSSADLAITSMLDALLTELLPSTAGADASQSRIEVEARRKRVKQLGDGGFPLRALDHARVSATTRLPELLALHRWDPWSRSIAVISGGIGCGKTVAATWWALARWPGDVGYVRAQTFAATGLDDDGSVDEFLRREALVLDDLGTEHLDAGDEFEELIDTYYANRRPLVITTSLSRTELTARYGARISSRLAEAGAWVSFFGPSLRA